MPTGKSADLSLFLDILKTLERINVPYMIIGAFAGTFYIIDTERGEKADLIPLNGTLEHWNIALLLKDASDKQLKCLAKIHLMFGAQNQTISYTES